MSAPVPVAEDVVTIYVVIDYKQRPVLAFTNLGKALEFAKQQTPVAGVEGVRLER